MCGGIRHKSSGRQTRLQEVIQKFETWHAATFCRRVEVDGIAQQCPDS